MSFVGSPHIPQRLNCIVFVQLCRGAGAAEEHGVRAVAADVSAKQLKQHLSYPAEWGPTEWGPIPFLPQPDVLVRNMERQWGDLDKYRGISTSAAGAKQRHACPA